MNLLCRAGLLTCVALASFAVRAEEVQVAVAANFAVPLQKIAAGFAAAYCSASVRIVCAGMVVTVSAQSGEKPCALMCARRSSKPGRSGRKENMPPSLPTAQTYVWAGKCE